MMHSDSQPAGLPQLCAQTRERFEAWESQELAGAERQQFEEHLSACRSCSRALAEFEYVSLRLRQSFVWQEPPADFTHRVMDEVRRHAALDDLQAPEPGFTGRLRDRLFGTADAAEDGQRDETAGRVESFADRAAERLANPADKPRHTLRLASLLLSAAALLVAALLIFGGDDAVQPEGGSSDAAWSYVEGERDDVLRLLTDGVSQHLAPQSALELPAQLSWQGTGMVLHGSLEQSSDGAGDAGSAELELSGEGALRFLAARELRLQGGALQLRAELGQDSNPRSTAPVSTAPMSVSLPSGLRVELSRAELALLVQRVHAHEQDEFLLEGPLYRVSVHVLGWRGARLCPRAGRAAAPGRGQTALGRAAPAAARVRDAIRCGAVRSRAPGPVRRRRARTGGAGYRSRRRSASACRRAARTAHRRAGRARAYDERGAYELRLALDTPLNAPGMVIASAPDGQQLRSSRALLGQVQGPEVQRRDFLLTAPGELVGRLVDAERAPLGGAEMQFVRIDTLLDRAERVASVRTESDGSFLASSLPELELGERLAVLIEAAGHPVFARYELEPEASTGRVELQAPELRQVRCAPWANAAASSGSSVGPMGRSPRTWLRLERHELPAGRRELRVSTMRGMELAHWEDDGRGMPSRLHVQRVNFETGELWPYVRERLTVVGRENGALLAQGVSVSCDAAMARSSTKGACSPTVRSSSRYRSRAGSFLSRCSAMAAGSPSPCTRAASPHATASAPACSLWPCKIRASLRSAWASCLRVRAATVTRRRSLARTAARARPARLAKAASATCDASSCA
jgi:hypothetical protein